MASEDPDVEGYAVPGIGARLARIFATGLMVATLAAPMAASSAPSFANPGMALMLTTPSPKQMIEAKAAALGGVAFTGKFVYGVEALPTGHRIRYQNCDIYYSPAAGAHAVHGAIRAKYDAMGGPFGHLGLPLTDELTTSDGIGRYSEFSFPGKAIYWSPDTGPFPLENHLRSVWVAHGAENGRFGYPTSAVQYRDGNQWCDFQNDVMYIEGKTLRTPATAGLSREQVTRALRKLITTGLADSFSVDRFTILGVSKTGYDFSQSRNRLITIEFKGSNSSLWDSGTHFVMKLSVLLFAQKEPDGSTTLRIRLVEQSGTVSSLAAGAYAANWLNTIAQRLSTGPKLIDVTLPAAVSVLSFKVLEDGEIKLFLPPGGGTPLAQLAVQLALDRLAK